MSSASGRLARVPAFELGLTLGDFLVPIRVGERLSARVRHVALVILGALFIALTARLVVPLVPVPITGQTFSVLLVGAALGFRRGLLAVLLYLAIGIVGLPVFAGGASGIGAIVSISGGRLLLGATGGYLIGMVLAAALVGRLAELGWDRRIWSAMLAMLLGNVVIYAFGLPWLSIAVGLDLERTLAFGLWPFVIGDALKLVVAAALLPVGWWLVDRRPADR
jgi:biotin transport system substrate-specific component